MTVDVCITGVGSSAVGRVLNRQPTDLALEACMSAMDDAGLSRDDIDGITAFNIEGSAGVVEVIDALGLKVGWFADVGYGPSQIASIFEAIMAVQTGRARHVLAFHSSCEGTVRQQLGRGGSLPGAASAVPDRVSGMQQWWLPFGAPSAGNHISMYAQRHFHDFGTTREQMAQIPLVQRANAGRYEKGIYRDPLTMDDYLNARMISEPFCLFDCDIPIDFSCAVVVSRADAVSGLRKRPISIEATSTVCQSRLSWDQFDDLSTMVLRDVGADLWTRTDLRPSDVDVAEIYDGFSFIAMAWLEALGFCGKGESGPFIEGGSRIALDGEIPINTNGGQLSSGRMHGWGYLPEACIQLWGEGKDRQVPNDPEVAVVASGGGVFAGALLLARS
ncbi:MAG: Acetyl-CoA acetyltransferase [Acidimicrobiia bacterium]|nr:Acetyl-CoA acetyltransferase [Acidimicrobiia bacterium]